MTHSLQETSYIPGMSIGLPWENLYSRSLKGWELKAKYGKHGAIHSIKLYILIKHFGDAAEKLQTLCMHRIVYRFITKYYGSES